LNRNYKIERTSRHVQKFRADRPAEFGDLVEKKTKNASNIEARQKLLFAGELIMLRMCLTKKYVTFQRVTSYFSF